MKNLHHIKKNSGFSLVVSVTILILLSLIAVGLLSLTASTVRSGQNNAAHLEAQANARLGLQIALAELQETMGPDQAVSAPAESFFPETAQPHLVGTWQSWSWDPAEDSKTPNYSVEKKSRFRGWLTSQKSPEGNLDFDYASGSVSDDSIRMLGQGSFGSNSNQLEIRSELIPLHESDSEPTGHLAWTVMAEDTKARIDLIRDEERPADSAHLASSLTFPERSHREALDLAGYQPDEESDWARLISTKSLDAAAEASGDDSLSQQYFFDYTTHSKGVLSDVANGGLKQDLTTILEENLFDGQRVYSGTTSPFGVADPHWSYLSDYYNQYLNFQEADSVEPIDVTANIALEDYISSDSSPARLALKPIVAKLQIVFSMVTHPLTVGGGNANAYSTADGNYAGQHLRPWLVFEPIITLWNPYSVPIEFNSLSIGLDKIPVGFRFAKKAGRLPEADLRVPSTASGRLNRSFWPLSHFVWGAGKEDAITNFSLNVRGGNMVDGVTREQVTLQPGENKIFSTFIKEGEQWGDVMDNFLIQGSDSVGSANSGSLIKGIDAVEGYNQMGGFRFDHIARFKEHRNTASLYAFEQSAPISDAWFHWCALRPQDSIVVKAKLANNDANSDAEVDSMEHFTMLVEVDQLGEVSDSEILGSSFTVREKDRLYDDENRDELLIERSFPAATIAQYTSDTTRGGKTPFAVFTMSAKSTNDLLSSTKGWLFGNPVLRGYEQDEDVAPQPLQSYEFSFREINSLNGFPMVEIDPETSRGYFGSGQSAATGLTASPMFALPTNPMVSVGQFQGANLISAVKPPFFNYPLGNSFAHPLLDPGSAISGEFVDHSYLLNQRLWDSFYFSGLSKGTESSNTGALDDFFKGESTLIPRLQPYLGQGGSVEEVISNLSSDPEITAREIAGYQMLDGVFNIHSTSVKAWKALLMSSFEVSVPTRDNEEHEVSDTTPFARLLPSYSEALNDLVFAAGSGDVGQDALRRAERWLGYHELTEEQCELLAENIVEQIKLRCAEDEGPFLSFGEFVNRRVGQSGSSFTDRGVLQTAIDLTNDPSDSSAASGEGTQGELFSLEDGVGIEEIDDRVINPEALEGNTAEGSPATLIQGDLLQQIGSVISVRSDTFRVRSYGNSVSQNGQVRAEAWCEAIVQRVPDFVDSSQSPGTDADLLNTENQKFGRRFRIVSFRWLAPQEV